ncbi:hypothetical protein [Streptomyces sp. NPDC101249]|uniref:hypothetical protein n=1 Tax=Streptomyces sp. NPDC101249 TaxID=3366140 RepID=UPI0037FBA22F
MTTQAEPDPRIAALMSVTKDLLTKYTELASSTAQLLPAEARAEVVEAARSVSREVQDRCEEIAAMGPGTSERGTYVLSTRPAVSGRPYSETTSD